MQPQDWDILLVEDLADDAQMVSQILEYYGIHIRVVSNGEECMAALDQQRPTLVISDLNMPSVDGWATIQAIRSDPALADLLVVAITAYYSPSIKRDAMNAGFNAFFAKPINPTTFVDELSQIIEGV